MKSTATQVGSGNPAAPSRLTLATGDGPLSAVHVHETMRESQTGTW